MNTILCKQTSRIPEQLSWNRRESPSGLELRNAKVG